MLMLSCGYSYLDTWVCSFWDSESTPLIRKFSVELDAFPIISQHFCCSLAYLGIALSLTQLLISKHGPVYVLIIPCCSSILLPFPQHALAFMPHVYLDLLIWCSGTPVNPLTCNPKHHQRWHRYLECLMSMLTYIKKSYPLVNIQTAT